jgi:hypothetical protein
MKKKMWCRKEHEHNVAQDEKKRKSSKKEDGLGRNTGWSAFASTAIPSFSLLEINDQDFCSLLDKYVCRNGPRLRRGIGQSFCGKN